MEVLELVESLKKGAERIKEERLEKIDFDKLRENLENAAETLEELKMKEETSEKILKDFKSEIRRMAHSLSRLKGDKAGLEKTERTLSTENLTYEELCLLRTRLQTEFEKTFSSVPFSRASYSFSKEKKMKDKIAEFKV